jgi:hypothetical protein
VRDAHGVGLEARVVGIGPFQPLEVALANAPNGV